MVERERESERERERADIEGGRMRESELGGSKRTLLHDVLRLHKSRKNI